MRIRSIIICVALIVLMTSISMSQYSAKETFNYAKGASIDTLMGGAGDGWAGPWYKVAASKQNVTVIADTGLPYDALNYNVPNVGRHLETKADTNGTELRYARDLDKTWPNDSGKVYWISLLMDVKYVADNSTWLGVKLFNGANGELCMLGKGHGLDKYTCGGGWHGSPGREVSNTVWSEGPQWLVGKVVCRGAANATMDTVYMWISPDPTAGEPKLKDTACLTAFKIPQITTVRVEYGGDVGTVGISASFDEIRLGTTWAQVSATQYAAKESFEYAKGASIDTLMGGAGDGWAGPWYKVAASKQNVTVIADTGLPYDALNYNVPNVGRHLETKADTNGTELRYARDLDKTWPNDSGKVYWISLLMDVKYVADNSTWLGVKLFNGANGELCMLGKGHGLDKYTCGGGWHGSPGREVSNTVWSEGPQWLVGKVVCRGAANATMDTVYMWISPDPTAGEPKLKDTACLTAFKIPQITTVRVEYGGDVGTVGISASFDEIRLGTTWADVSSSLGQVVTGVPYASKSLPNRFALSQNYPNPFNPSTQILYTLTNSSKVRLTVFDLLGRQVAVLVDGVQSAGQHTVQFSGAGFTSGVYFYKLENNSDVVTKKMLLLK